MGMRVLKPHEPLCEVDLSKYAKETSLKRQLLADAHSYYFHGGEATMTAQWDVLELVATDLAQNYPEHFQLQRNGDAWRWQNALIGTIVAFRFGNPATLPCEPLDWIGRQLQEDLVLLSGDANASFIGG